MSQRAVIALLADMHTGHAFALMPDGGWTDGDGNHTEPNELQDLIHQHWITCWEKCRELRKRSRLIVAHSGDAIEGVHHGGHSLCIQERNEQEQAHIVLMREALQLAGYKRGDSVHYIMGTEPTHVGPRGASEERIIRALLDIDEEEAKRQLHRHLLGNVNNVLLDIAHQGPSPGIRNWTRGNVLRYTMESLYRDALELHQPPPRYYIRAHRHVFRHVDIMDRRGKTIMDGFILPAWKLKDDYVYRVAVDALSSIGMIFVVVEADGRTWWDDCLIDITQDRIIEL